METETLVDELPVATATAVAQPETPLQPTSSNAADGGVSEEFLTPEELVAKSKAPVKREYLRPPPSRPSTNNNNNTTVGVENDDAAEAKRAPLLKDKKSKRQIKRERREEQKSPLHLCPVVAKSRKVSACSYGDKCRFSHDVEAFKAVKPADIEGSCPFLDYEGPCPYGLACRFAGTHRDNVSAPSENLPGKSSELNFFSKDTQKLLWKNKMKFPKAEATLKLLGLKGNPKDKTLADNVENGQVTPKEPATDTKTDSNVVANDSVSPSISPEDDVDGNNLADDARPLKKAKSSVSEICPSQVSSGLSVQGGVPDDNFGVNKSEPTADTMTDSDKSLKLHPREKKLIDFRDKLYLAPLTTVGNLPFRRVCKVLGADVTCGEMAMCTNLLQGQAAEWALLRRHSSENLFGVQICGAFPDTITKTVELIEQECSVDFIDINMGCPIDVVVNKGAGSALLTKPMRMKSVVEAASSTVSTPVTIKVRTAYFEGKNRIDSLIADMGSWGATAVTIHGRSRQQRYSKPADWDYVYQCARKAPKSLQVLGNGDVFSYVDWNNHKIECPELSTCMIARGALVKPWIFTEIKEQRHWDITSGERLDILKDYARFGLQHWGSDSKGVDTTRHFLLEWLSYTCRYIPVGLLDIIPQKINWRSPSYYGRDELETLMASDSAADWVRISELVLGKVPSGYSFAPKHKSNAYDRAENG
ncbi:tRNA-dihydrouridine(47) synthase [NAD(P)(+)]-like [Solanum lycopersicum]|uniref:tRNA-dihydrouridine(47) synthase [NAD(P)(+)] n=1 Tax=Solanum lycopersicum TaxID=4081 RepID=A0A3Q7FEA4_SOLLC|nr:tRNA-dihydrouridine(47) synthase [NAD(P)(+)]-like [Solanum lycopersicum]